MQTSNAISDNKNGTENYAKPQAQLKSLTILIGTMSYLTRTYCSI